MLCIRWYKFDFIASLKNLNFHPIYARVIILRVPHEFTGERVNAARNYPTCGNEGRRRAIKSWNACQINGVELLSLFHVAAELRVYFRTSLEFRWGFEAPWFHGPSRWNARSLSLSLSRNYVDRANVRIYPQHTQATPWNSDAFPSAHGDMRASPRLFYCLFSSREWPFWS